MWIALVAPVAVGLAYKVLFNFAVTRKEFVARLTRTYAKISSPILILTTMLMIIPFFLLWNSDLCGPSYMELQYGPKTGWDTSSSSHSSGDHKSADYPSDGDQEEFEGTTALLHDGLLASCQISWGGKVYLSWIGFYYPLILMVNAYVLLRTAKPFGSRDYQRKGTDHPFQLPQTVDQSAGLWCS
jgi:hypothetical protein